MEKLFEKLWSLSNRKFIESVKFGLVAVDATGAVRHFCGYVAEPTTSDWVILERELRTNESFGLVGEHFIIERAPQEVVDWYLRELKDEDGWDVHKSTQVKQDLNGEDTR